MKVLTPLLLAALLLPGRTLGAESPPNARFTGSPIPTTGWAGEHGVAAVFTVRVPAGARDGREGSLRDPGNRFAFRLAPPWWRTGWALAGCALLGALGVIGVFKFRTRALHRRAVQLEGMVAERTLQLQVHIAELARLHQLELGEKILARLSEQRALLAEEQARLEMLRYQLNPHFLFNALASISGLAVTQADAARDMIGKLSEFCRLSLARGRNEHATLAEEFRMLQLYLAVEKIRWEDGLQIGFTLDDAVRDVRLPAFLLLPVVENAVKYGSQTSPDLLEVRVSARRDADDSIDIEIANTGTWLPDASTPGRGTHIGLDNARERLARSFPNRHTFVIEAAGGWVRVRLRIASERQATAEPAAARALS